ncbi:MAG: hypothetical protein QM767_26840 [Anaeromyxobacter sp.]
MRATLRDEALEGWASRARSRSGGDDMHFLDPSRSARAVALLALAVVLVAPTASRAAGAKRVTLDSIKGAFGEVPILGADPLASKKVEWQPTGKARYDQFLQDAAFMDAGMIVSQATTDTLTTSLKGYARNIAASGAMKDAAKEIVGDTPPDQLSEEQSLALLALKKKMASLSEEELAFATKGAASATVVGGFLAKVPETSTQLVEQGSSLSQSVSKDFTGFDAMKVPGVGAALALSGVHVKDAAERAPELAKAITRLAQGLGSLL